MTPTSPSLPAVVVDTTVHVAAVGSRNEGSPTREVIHRGASGHFSFVLSPKLRREIARKLIERFALPAALVGRYIAQLDAVGVALEDAAPDGSVWCRDEADLFVLMLARTASAWGVVTYDGDFNDEAQERSAVSCWPPIAFLALLRKRRGEPASQRHAIGAEFPAPK
jgi:predicted nucleic acid-binding protein